MKLTERPRRAGFILLSGGLLATVACGAPPPLASTSGAGTPRAVTIEAKDFAFEPATLTLSGGQAVRLTLINSGAIDHDWTVAGLSQSGKTVDSGDHGVHGSGSLPAGSVHVGAHGGQQKQIEFTPKPGTYDMYCSVPGHREQGMRGTLTVS